MRQSVTTLTLALALAGSAALASGGADDRDDDRRNDKPRGEGSAIQLGPRPFFLINEMEDSRLKRELQQCSEGPFRKSDFSIGHLGAALQFPEHTRESYTAAARMGAGIVECDVTFTKDKQLVCRHAQNDLHTTTNILATPLAGTCIKPFSPAIIAADGTLTTPASAECRTSDHKESIELFKALHVKMTPELKSPSVTMPFNGFTQEMYAQKMIDEYKAAGVPSRRVWPQSFDQRDVLCWINNEPAFGKQAVYLDDANVVADLPTFSDLVGYKQMGINIWAPPTFALLTVSPAGRITVSQAAKDARTAGLDIITWTLERSGILADGNNGFYYQTIDSAVSREGDLMKVIDVLAREVGVLGVFSDWAAPVTYYANCMGLK
jgi:glycerophosphoryl diester phosphodiesterase